MALWSKKLLLDGGLWYDGKKYKRALLRRETVMSIVINIYYTGEGGNARRFAEEMEVCGIAGEIRREEGNLRYDYFFPMGDAETVLLIDCWKNQEAIDRHHASSMMKKIAELREKYDLHMRVERYVSDEGGMPEEDGRFIRE